MVGITLQFDTATGTAPIDFTITAYENGAVKNTWPISGNTDVVYQGELGIEDADRIRIEFIKARPYNRIPVSYTHLDVYKRQGKHCGNSFHARW